MGAGDGGRTMKERPEKPPLSERLEGAREFGRRHAEMKIAAKKAKRDGPAVS